MFAPSRQTYRNTSRQVFPQRESARIPSINVLFVQIHTNKSFQSVIQVQSDVLSEAVPHRYLLWISFWQDVADSCGGFKCHLLSVLLSFKRKKEEKECHVCIMQKPQTISAIWRRRKMQMSDFCQ